MQDRPLDKELTRGRPSIGIEQRVEVAQRLQVLAALPFDQVAAALEGLEVIAEATGAPAIE